MNCEDASEFTCTTPPIPGAGWTLKGRVSPSMRAPRSRSASSTAPMGRTRASGSPSKKTVPDAVTATGGTKRMTVPARPQLTEPPVNGCGVTRSVRFGAPE